MTPAEARSVVLRHLYAMPDPQTVTAAEMHAVDPGLSVERWDDELWRMGRWTEEGNLLSTIPPGRVDVRGTTTRWTLTGRGYAVAKRLTGEVAA